MSETYCRICEAACGLRVEGDGASLRLKPDRAHPVSGGFVCAKGTRFGEVARHPARRVTPALRDGDGWRDVSWDHAIEDAARRLRRTIDEHGPHAVGIYLGNPLAFHAAGQIAAAFFGKAIGSRNTFSAGSQDCNNKFAASQIMHGTPVIQPIPDFEHAEQAILFGTNPAVSQSSFVHLEGGSSIFDRMAARGARITWVDVRRTESAKRWGELVRVKPGTDVWLILAMLGHWSDRAPERDDRVEGLAPLLALARGVSFEDAEARTGVPAETIRELAGSLGRRTALHMSVGVNMGPFGTLSYVALQALAYCSGNYDRRGGSVFSPVGVHGARLARQVGLFTTDARSRIGDFPTVFDTLPGGVLADEILTEGDERIRALVVIAGDPIRSIPGSRRLERAIASLDTLVCLDMFESKTAAHADVFMPCTTWLERADLALPGLPLQTVDLLQTTRAISPAPGEARPEHEILAALSLAMDRPLFGSARASRVLSRRGLLDRWIPRVTELAWRLADRDPARRGYGIRIPTPRPGTYLGKGPMTPGRKVRFWDPQLEVEKQRLLAWQPREDGFVLLGRRRRIGHNSWLHGGVRDGNPEGQAWMSPEDTRRLSLADGDRVTLKTSGGELTLPIKADEGVAPGTVVVPHGVHGLNINELLPDGVAHIEPTSGQLHMTGLSVELRAAPQPVAHA